jgi:sulfur-oxidizing protein SoxB
MNPGRREFLQLLALASAAGFTATGDVQAAQKQASTLYDLPRFGQVHLLHFTDCHAQLKPVYFREPSVNLGFGAQSGRTPHLVGQAFLQSYGITAKSRAAHAFTHLDFASAARVFGKVGGFAHLATLIRQIKASRPGALLLDGALVRHCGPKARTWWMPALRWGWMS